MSMDDSPAVSPRLWASRPCVGTALFIQRQHALSVVGLYLAQPVLMLVDTGELQLVCDGIPHSLKAGEALVLAGKQTISLQSSPDQMSSTCHVWWLVWEPALLQAFASQCPPGISPVSTSLMLGKLSAAAREACQRASIAVQDEHLPLEIARHHWLEVLWWLRHYGAILQEPAADTTKDKVRNLIAAQPAKDWTGPKMAAELAMSEATLRRRLAAEETSFSELLLDTRLSLAVQLLHLTAFPITRIAQDVGYDSPSHFTQRFRQRFGLLPSAIREANPVEV